MYIVFIDESGQPGGWNEEKKCLTNNSSKYFTLSGFMIEADNILNLELAFKDIKLKYGIKESTEVKWSSSYSKLGLNYEQYINMNTDIINMISQYKNSVIGICNKNQIIMNFLLVKSYPSYLLFL